MFQMKVEVNCDVIASVWNRLIQKNLTKFESGYFHLPVHFQKSNQSPNVNYFSLLTQQKPGGGKSGLSYPPAAFFRLC